MIDSAPTSSLVKEECEQSLYILEGVARCPAKADFRNPRNSISYFSVAVIKHHDPGNLQKEAISWLKFTEG